MRRMLILSVMSLYTALYAQEVIDSKPAAQPTAVPQTLAVPAPAQTGAAASADQTGAVPASAQAVAAAPDQAVAASVSGDQTGGAADITQVEAGAVTGQTGTAVVDTAKDDAAQIETGIAAAADTAVAAPPPPALSAAELASAAIAAACAAIDSLVPGFLGETLAPPADSALPAATAASADAAIALGAAAANSAWESIDSALVQKGYPPVEREKAAAASVTAVRGPRAALTALIVDSKWPPRLWTREKNPPPQGTTNISLLLGWAVTPSIGGDPSFKPWWKSNLYASYKDIDPDLSFCKGLSIDLTLYSFDEKEYSSYYKDKGNIEKAELSWVSIEPLLVVDLDYYAKWYPYRKVVAPYILSSVGVCGMLGGVGEDSRGVRYSNQKHFGDEENLVGDAFVLRLAAGIGVDVPIYDEVRFYIDMQYVMRAGLFTIFEFEGNAIKLGGFVTQLPIRFGVLVPVRAKTKT